jgi:hypothetical protein
MFMAQFSLPPPRKARGVVPGPAGPLLKNAYGYPARDYRNRRGIGCILLVESVYPGASARILPVGRYYRVMPNLYWRV